MDGSALIWPSSRGGGSVSCSPDCNNLEQQFFITPIAEDTNIYTIQSVAYPGVYLRMDGTGLDEFALRGGGVVNCQRGVASYEKFQIVYNASQYAGCSRSSPRHFLLSTYVLMVIITLSIASTELSSMRCMQYDLCDICAP